MFRFHKPLDIVTLFHKPSLASSTRALNLLKQASATANETATEDQASDHKHHMKIQRSPFEFNVTEEPPTPDQLKIIMDYMSNQPTPAELVEGARDRLDALKRCKEDGERFQRPVIVDWNNGKAVIGTDESAILRLLSEEPPESQDA